MIDEKTITELLINTDTAENFMLMPLSDLVDLLKKQEIDWSDEE